jgi:CP family cyanate transporter-like MFS transporter
MIAPSPAVHAVSHRRLLAYLGLLWLAGAGLRLPILAVPPVIPLIRGDLGLSETQVGLLMGLPLVLFALAAVPGSLLIARFGTLPTLLAGLVVAALASAARGAAPEILSLYAATVVMGFGVAIMQPALPPLVREWLPQRVNLGIATYTNGALLGSTFAVMLSIPFVLPLVGGSWRLDFVVWSAPVLLTALLIALLAPRTRALSSAAPAIPRRWWPDWKNPLTWLLGLTFGSNNSMYFATNAFLPEYLESVGRADLITIALTWLNLAQVVASFVLMWAAQRLQHRAWPYLVFGVGSLVGIVGIVFSSGIWIVIAATVFGFATAMTFVIALALPAVLSAPEDVHRTAAGMFTISYSGAVIVPIVSGALWDLTHIPALAFLPIGLCAVALTVFGPLVHRIGGARDASS